MKPATRDTMFKLNVQELEKKGHETTKGKSGGGGDENSHVVLRVSG